MQRDRIGKLVTSYETSSHAAYLVEGARVLSRNVQFDSEGGKCAAVDTVTVSCTLHIWSGGMDGSVNHVRSSIQAADFPSRDDSTFMIDLDEIRGPDMGKWHAKRIDPECCRIDRIPQRDVSCYTLFVAVFCKDAECECKSSLEILLFLDPVFKYRWFGKCRTELGHLWSFILRRTVDWRAA